MAKIEKIRLYFARSGKLRQKPLDRRDQSALGMHTLRRPTEKKEHQDIGRNLVERKQLRKDVSQAKYRRGIWRQKRKKREKEEQILRLLGRRHSYYVPMTISGKS